MGSEVQLERYMPGHLPMRELRELGEDASSSAWNYYNRKFQGTAVELYSEYEKDLLKQKMLEHDAVFRRQVSELHRLYRTQRDLMEEMKRSELYNHQKPFFLNPPVYRRQDSAKHVSVFPASNSACTSPSVLGAENASPHLSFLKGKTPKTDLSSAKDADDSNDCEIIECRPGKVRRKMFDLRLSADEYIDPDQVHQNEPIQIEDDLPTRDFMNHRISRNSQDTESLALKTPAKTYSRDTSLVSCYGGDFGQSGKPLLVNRETSRAKLPHPLKESSFTQYLRPDNYPEPSRLLNGTSRGASFHVHPDQSKEKFASREPVIGHQHQIRSINYQSDELVNCWPRLVASWEKYGRDSGQKRPHLLSSVRSSQASNQPSNEEKLNINSAYAVDAPRLNELNHRSSSGSKEESICYPSVKFENLGSCRDGAGASGCSGNLISHEYSRGLNGIDLNCAEEMDLNATAANDAAHETAIGQNLVAADRQSRYTTTLPWLKPKPFCGDSAQVNLSRASSRAHDFDSTSSSNGHVNKKVHGFIALSQPLTAGSFRLLSKGRKSELKQNIRVFDMNLPCETEGNMEAPAAEKTVDTKVTGFKNLLDLNSCVTEDEVSTNSGYNAAKNVRGIDLEAPALIEVEEDVIRGEDYSAGVQQTQQEAELERAVAEAMISLSSLKEHKLSARDACGSLSTASETLKWFVGVVSSCPSDPELTLNANPQPNDRNDKEPITETSCDEIDYFEHMTLKLTEMSVEDYFPKSAFLLIPSLDEEGVNSFTGARPRRGQARRGRPKRDFQRDILPGLASLSRHEVSEDIQAFDGLMKAGGHAWQLGKRAAGRNKARRGRPRTVNVAPVPPPPSCVDLSMEDGNLTGWGKTTRRPRRRRCPAGNGQPVRII